MEKVCSVCLKPLSIHYISQFNNAMCKDCYAVYNASSNLLSVKRGEIELKRHTTYGEPTISCPSCFSRAKLKRGVVNRIECNFCNFYAFLDSKYNIETAYIIRDGKWIELLKDDSYLPFFEREAVTIKNNQLIALDEIEMLFQKIGKGVKK